MPWLQRIFGQIVPNQIALAMARPGAILLAERRLRRLDAFADPMAKRLAMVIRRLRAGQIDDPFKLIERIEREREDMLRSKQVLRGPFDEGRTIGSLCTASKGRRAATLLHALIREFQPGSALELGTNLGISCAYQAAALRSNGSGKLVTIELAPLRVEVARKLHQTLGLDNVTFVAGAFSDVLPGVLETLRPVDYAFIDGHHQMQPTLDYFQAIWPNLSDNAIVVFDDIRWSPGMQRAWRILQADPRIRIAIDLVGVGVCVSTKTPTADGRYLSSAIAC